MNSTKKKNNSGKTCIIKIPGETDRIVTRRALSDHFEAIIEDNIGYGFLHGATDAEIKDYKNRAIQEKRKVLAYFDSHETPVFGWDNDTELPIIIEPDNN